MGLSLVRRTWCLSILSCLLCRELLTTLFIPGVSILTVVMALLLLPRCTQKVPTFAGQLAMTAGPPNRLLVRQCLRLDRRLTFYLIGNLKDPLVPLSSPIVLAQATCLKAPPTTPLVAVRMEPLT